MAEERPGGLHPYVAYLKERYPGYEQWAESQGVPVIAGHHVPDCRTQGVAPWPAVGGRGVLLNLSEQSVDDAHLVEIPAGESLLPHHHLFEEVVFVVAGRGATTVWQEESGPRSSFEWQAGSLFAVPVNAWHQHFNVSASEPARLLSVTSAPLTMNLFHSLEAVFECPFAFADRFGGEPDFFDGAQTFRDEVHSGLYETNFVADVRSVALRDWAARGRGQSIFLCLASGTMKVHLARFPRGTYKKAHRHGPGAHIYVLDGEGYTLMWEPGGTPRRFDWHEGSLVSPPNGWYHQHFNLGDGPAVYLAFHRPQVIHNRGEGHQIEYGDEDPAIRREYAADLARRGVALDMPLPGAAGEDRGGRRSGRRRSGDGDEDGDGVHPYVTYLKRHYDNYGRFQADEGLPVVRGFHVEDAAALRRAPWRRLGGLGCYVNLSEQEYDDAYVLEIPPGESLREEHHLFEELVYVLDGRGATAVWQPGEAPTHFEWQRGSLFAIPLNAFHRHFNGDGHRPALLLAVTSAPLMMNLFHNRDFVFSCPWVFRDRFAGRGDEFEAEPRWVADVPGGLWETNFIPDVHRLRLIQWEQRGQGFTHAYVALAGNVMKVHLAEFAAGTYKKAHRHGPGAHILILSGTGYSLMWRPGEEPRRFDWRPGTLISPPGGWYHQHFNPGAEPVFHLAFHRPQAIYDRNEHRQIEYEDQAPWIHRLFADECRQAGTEMRLRGAFATRGAGRASGGESRDRKGGADPAD